MSFGLTETATRTHIDHTGDAPHPATTPFPHAPIQLLPVQHEEPPLKRRRVENADTLRRSLKECLQEQVLPHVSQVVRTLPEGTYHVDKIAVQAVTTLARSARFRTRLDETNGYLTPEDEAVVVERIRDEITRLAKLPENRIHVDSHSVKLLPDAINPLGLGSEPARKQLPKAAWISHLTINENLYDIRDFERLPYRHRVKRTEPQSNNPFFRLNERPYRSAADRNAIAKGTFGPFPSRRIPSQPTVYHVDFTPDEISEIAKCVSEYEQHEVPATLEALAKRCHIYDIPRSAIGRLKGRTVEDVRNFCTDLLAGQVTPVSDIRVLSMSQDTDNERAQLERSSRVTSLLLAREMEGNIGFGRTRQLVNFQTEFKRAREDSMRVVAEFTNCAGDITTGSWVSNEGMILGTTAHSDTHNQQYNKPGNLLLCSTTDGTLRAFEDHRIPRPMVETGENSTDAMRHSQDPWLYSSVVSSDYDDILKLVYTSSFDNTVKVWKVDLHSRGMVCIATWKHKSRVNFVVASKDGSGRVATAADSPTEAIRIYQVTPGDVMGVRDSPYQSLSCSRLDADGSDKWAYFPATMQWGIGTSTERLLLVGYSPRSLSGDDLDIPEDKRNSGEITLWDAEIGRRLPVTTASTANVFEVAWHPVLPCFIIATTPCSFSIDHNVRTQIHIFRQDFERPDPDVAYIQFQSLDCYGSDINELTFQHNSIRYAYITAACTDGNTYVWDTAQGDKPIHILKHGYPLEEFYEDREREDTGVKFTAWGKSPDRFYTGSSDGKVKVWNVRHKGQPFVRTLLEAPGPISFGAFSPDMTKLAVGDATGRVFILSVDERDEHESHFVTLPGSKRRVRRPMPFIPHREPAHPNATFANSYGEMVAIPPEKDNSESDIVSYSRNTYLDSQQLVLNRNPVIGTVQGPQYAETGLFRREAHLNDDPSRPLLADFERHQQASAAASRGLRCRSVRRLKMPGPADAELRDAHGANRARDLHIADLPKSEAWGLHADGALLDPEEDWGFDYEDMPVGSPSATSSP
ncbi:WD40-repeat-containing domain protein [Dactylonectria estremocensis]|uniref:WD40-repeat-containing domain protein n=1 Tax=Dactylonectria estremocensis TaxID=1079267 RepID=A0A9P9E9Q2_9HYPO|nr:WD40-repeat-containing domain protein [Dactylonectria estremocensis]